MTEKWNQYKIADIPLQIFCDPVWLKDRLKIYQDETSEPEAAYEILFERAEPAAPSSRIRNMFLKDIYELEDGWAFRIPKEGAVAYLVKTDKDYRKVKIYTLLETIDRMKKENPASFQTRIQDYLFRTIRETFCLSALSFDGIYVHGVLMEYRGNGILFSAPSGTGKTTHCDLWKKYYGDQIEILNGDNCVLRMQEGVCYAHSLPWSGSSDFFCQKKVPLKAIIFLKQYKENEIHSINGIPALVALMQRSFLPQWDDVFMMRAVDTAEKILRQAVCARLLCRPDQAAAEAAKSWIDNDGA